MEATNELTYRRYEALREAKGYSNYRVSKESGVGQSTLSDWKSGKITRSWEHSSRSRRRSE